VRRFETLRESVGDDVLRSHVLAGAYRLHDATGQGSATATGVPTVHLLASGPVLPEVLAAAELLAAEGVAANVFDVTSADRLYRGWRGSLQRAASGGVRPADTHQLATLLPLTERRAPMVTVQDAASHALAWVGSVFGQRVVPVGVDGFGQSGTIAELYGSFDLLPDQLVNAALVALG
jgi:pyruvate dehydrogenase E1 component